jgi:hypothetical protein
MVHRKEVETVRGPVASVQAEETAPFSPASSTGAVAFLAVSAGEEHRQRGRAHGYCLQKRNICEGESADP